MVTFFYGMKVQKHFRVFFGRGTPVLGLFFSETQMAVHESTHPCMSARLFGPNRDPDFHYDHDVLFDIMMEIENAFFGAIFFQIGIPS